MFAFFYILNRFKNYPCQVSTKDAGDIDITKAALEKRLKAITFVHRVSIVPGKQARN